MVAGRCDICDDWLDGEGFRVNVAEMIGMYGQGKNINMETCSKCGTSIMLNIENRLARRGKR